MRQNKHTQGPWRYDKDRSSIMAKSDYIDGETEEEIFDLTASCGCVGNNFYETDANILLITAAPELLEALEDLLDCVPDRDGYTDESNETLINKAKKAINKAKGE